MKNLNNKSAAALEKMFIERSELDQVQMTESTVKKITVTKGTINTSALRLVSEHLFIPEGDALVYIPGGIFSSLEEKAKDIYRREVEIFSYEDRPDTIQVGFTRVGIRQKSHRIVKEIKEALISWSRAMKLGEAGFKRTNLLSHWRGFDVISANYYIQEKWVELGGDWDESPLGPYDAAGVWGLGEHTIKQVWFACGATDGHTYRWHISRILQDLKEKGRVDYTAIPKKGWAKPDLFRAYEKVRKLVDYQINYISRQLILRLANLSYKARLAAWNLFREEPLIDIYGYTFNDREDAIAFSNRKGLKRPPFSWSEGWLVSTTQKQEVPNGTSCYRLTHEITKINWEALAQWLKKDKVQQLLNLSDHLNHKDIFYTLMGRIPKIYRGEVGCSNKQLIELLINPKKVKLLRKIIQVTQKKVDSTNHLIVAIRLVGAFNDVQSIERWVDASSRNWHDAAQFPYFNGDQLPLNNWSSLMTKFPEIQWKSGLFQKWENEKGHFHSKKAFLEWTTTQNYTFSGPENVLTECAKHSLSSAEAKDYVEFFAKNDPKNSIEIPFVSVEVDGYTLQTLEVGDITGPFLGLATNCCQHLHNAASGCAKNGYRKSWADFWVVQNQKGQIVAQSWVWRGSNTIVIDSIESKGLSDSQVKVLSDLYLAAGQQAIGKLDITRVGLSGTNYGYTKEIGKKIEQLCSFPRKGHRCPKKPFGHYADATKTLTMVA